MTTTIKENGKETSPPTLRDPFSALRDLQRSMMRSVFEPLLLQRFDIDLAPSVNLKEQDGTYVLDCALPGYKKDDVSVEIRGDAVTISGTYKQEKNEEQARYHQREMRQGSFARTIELPAEIDADKASATFENGMLKLTLPPSKTTPKKTIPISG